MSYKQNNNPFSGSQGPASFKNPKNKGTSNFNALEFQMPDLSNILNKTADGETVIQDETNDDRTGTPDEGKVDGTATKSIIDELADSQKPSSEKTYQDLVKEKKEAKKDFKQQFKQVKKMAKDRANLLTNEERQQAADALATLKDKRKFDRDARKANISVEQAIMNEAEAQKVAAAEAEKEKLEKEKELQIEYEQRLNDPDFQMQVIGPNLGNKGMKMKQVKTKGKGFPMVNPQQDPIGNPEPPAKGTMEMGGRPLNSGVLSNDPNNNLDPSKVSAQQENNAQQFSAIASSAGTPTPQYNPYQTQMQGMAFNAKLEKALELGQLKNNPEFEKKVADAVKEQKTSAQERESEEKTTREKELKDKLTKGTSMHSMNHAHTKVTKGNLKATEKDDAAHMDYLKRDINYDAKHGGSKKQMLDDEKHISKLAGDLKYDVKHHGRKYDNV